MDNSKDNAETECPICEKMYRIVEIEQHVNKCMFLNSTHEEPSKRKRSPSPVSPVLQFSATKTNKARLSQPKSPSDYTSPPKKQKITPSPSTSHDGKAATKNQKPVLEKDFTFTTPLAKLVQPKSLDDFIGQGHILGEHTTLRALLNKGEVPNMILWGPPGCGKTSLSSVIQGMAKENPTKLRFVTLCATTCGVKDVQNVVSEAKLQMKFKRRTILFMDEIHRFNKRQQDTFLLHVEKGEIILVGATTENPSFTINSALLSRCRVIVLQKLEPESLITILQNAAANLNVEVVVGEDVAVVLGDDLKIRESALRWLADISDGDARIALGNLQLVLQSSDRKGCIVGVDDIKENIKKSHLLYDRKGEEHYNVISAMHKSIRGSDPSAALYWTTRMIVSGEDPLFIARRMVRAASEDIGNADPNALQLAISTMQGCQLLGMPESDVLLAQCAIYLARAPKSREADSALAAAKRVINECKGIQPDVPLHLRNAPTKLMSDLGYGRDSQRNLPFMPLELKHVNFF